MVLQPGTQQDKNMLTAYSQQAVDCYIAPENEGDLLSKVMDMAHKCWLTSPVRHDSCSPHIYPQANYAYTRHYGCSFPSSVLTYGIKTPSWRSYPSPRTCRAFCYMLFFIYGEELLAPLTTTKPPVVGCPRLVNNMFTATSSIWCKTPPSATLRRPEAWWPQHSYTERLLPLICNHLSSPLLWKYRD
jgi:hypothetical protein